MVRSVGFAVGAFALYGVFHVLSVRTLRPSRYFALSLQLLIAVLVGYGCALLVQPFSAVERLHGLLIFGSLWALYMEATFIVLRSVSVRAMVEMVQAPGHALRAEQLEQLYGTEEMFDRRIESLVANGYLIERREGVTLTARGAWTAAAFELVRRLFNLHVYG